MSKLFIKQIPIGPMMNYAYLVGMKDGREVVAIDTAWSAPEILEEAKNDGRKIVAVLLTHTHYDHCNAVEELAGKINLPVYVHEEEGGELPKNLNIKNTREGTVVKEAGLDINCMHTPGHTPGSQCFLIDDVLFTGDTLFVDSCGRVDLPGSSSKDMEVSLKKLSNLPENIVVFPGHNYGVTPKSTIGEQKKSNPYLGA
jgi:hydroxyacylglutathione hydrolase